MGNVASSYFKLRNLSGGSTKGSNSNKSSPTTFTASKGDSDNNWVLNIRTTHHITNDSSSLDNLVPYNGHDNILIGNVTSIPISSLCFASFSVSISSLVLKDVLHAPRVASNLVSVHKLCKITIFLLSFTLSSFVSRTFL